MPLSFSFSFLCLGNFVSEYFDTVGESLVLYPWFEDPDIGSVLRCRSGFERREVGTVLVLALCSAALDKGGQSVCDR